jgi:mono/diheme cytochrome c family protein
MTLPPAQPDGNIVYLPAPAYYRLRPLTIYRTYAVYHPDLEPKGYMAELEQREPETVFFPEKLSRESDWVRAGKIVFEAPTEFMNASIIRNRTWLQNVRPPVTSTGIVPGIYYVIRKKGVVELGVGSCATCHGRVLPDGTYVSGAQGNFPVERAYAEALRRELPKRPQPRLTAGLLFSPAEVAGWTEHLYERSADEIIAISNAMIPGVVMRSGFSYLDPAKTADLIGIRDRRYLDLTARLLHRSLPDIARYGSMCWASNYFFSRKNEVSNAVISSVAESMRYTDEQAYGFALYVYSLKPPRNPNRPSARTRKGQAVFKREGCPKCHTPPLYTNNKISPAGDFAPPASHRELYDILEMRVGTDASAALKSLRGRGYYKVPSLKGVWYRGPFVHNGTIATLEDWFEPRRLRKDYVPTGYRAHGVSYRSVPGHPFGLSLNPEDKAALIAFLRTL